MFFGEVIASINSNQWLLGSCLWFSVLTNEELTISKQLIKTFFTNLMQNMISVLCN